MLEEEECDEEEDVKKKKKKETPQELEMKKALKEMRKIPITSWAVDLDKFGAVLELRQFLKFLNERKERQTVVVTGTKVTKEELELAVAMEVDYVVLNSLVEGEIVGCLIEFCQLKEEETI